MIKVLLLIFGVMVSIIGLVDTIKRITRPDAHADMATLFFAMGFALSIVVLTGHIVALML